MSLSRELDVAAVSAREGEVLAALGEHLTNAEIADRLFISVRTVESHVSSLLRKLGAADRRALARVAAADAGGGASAPDDLGADSEAVPVPGVPHAGAVVGVARRPAGVASLPSPLTPFVGRVAERADLAEALAGQRLVTALGPGGVGKTRLALVVAGDVADRFPGGVWFVELVPVSDRSMIAPAIAAALGLGEQAGRLVEDTVLDWFADRRALLVLDNCEHLVDGVAPLVERLLTRCPGVSVLATSRTRLLLPFERPFPVPGLSLAPGAAPEPDEGGASAEPDDGAGGDAVALLVARAAAVGVPVTTAADRRRAAAVCRALDGMALAIELAASRLPALGLDGLEAGLADRLRVLTGGGRADERHRSLRATLDWSYELADPADQALLRRVAVFSSAFTARAAAEVAALDEAPDAAADGLARLVDQSLLVAVRTGGETRYRALETVRQYADERCADAERDAVRARHLAWSLASADALVPDGPVDGAWRSAFDDVADDLRSARSWAAARPEHRADALLLTEALAGLAWNRGRGVEAQHRWEEAADLAPDLTVRAAMLQQAAHAAANRHAGDDAVPLYRQAAEVAVAAGVDGEAARNLALAAMLVRRCPGIMSEAPPPGTVRDLLRRAATLAVGHPEVDAILLVAEAFDGDERDDQVVGLAERAVELARRTGDAVAESAALDHVTAVALARGDVAGGAAVARHRLDRFTPYGPAAAYELPDALHMASESALGAGDVAGALRFAHRLDDLPSHRDLRHMGINKLLVVHALTGTWQDVPAMAERFHEGWVGAGRPLVSSLARGSLSVAFVHGMRGDEDERARWAATAQHLRCAVDSDKHGDGNVSFEPLVEGLVHLHRGEPDAAMVVLDTPPEQFRRWFSGMWLHWYAAAWAEATALSGHPDVAARLSRARFLTAGNPVAGPLVERAAALAEGRLDGLPALADALDRAGCPYQAARTRVLAGGDHRAQGEAALAAVGATPMPVG